MGGAPTAIIAHSGARACAGANTADSDFVNRWQSLSPSTSC